jgi:hypothetical protein
MKFDLRSPCVQCPFRHDIEFYLGRGRVRDIYDSLTLGDASFSCHKTTHFDDDGHYDPDGSEQHCAGAMIMLIKQRGYGNQIMRIAERLDLFDPDQLDLNAPVFECVEDMIDAREHAYRRRP